VITKCQPKQAVELAADCTLAGKALPTTGCPATVPTTKPANAPKVTLVKDPKMGERHCTATRQPAPRRGPQAGDTPCLPLPGGARMSHVARQPLPGGPCPPCPHGVHLPAAACLAAQLSAASSPLPDAAARPARPCPHPPPPHHLSLCRPGGQVRSVHSRHFQAGRHFHPAHSGHQGQRGLQRRLQGAREGPLFFALDGFRTPPPPPPSFFFFSSPHAPPWQSRRGSSS
jgi:hypothetical protein